MELCLISQGDEHQTIRKNHYPICEAHRRQTILSVSRSIILSLEDLFIYFGGREREYIQAGEGQRE